MLINATSRSSGPQTAGPTPHERGRRAFSYGAGPVGWGPELREVALIKISLSFAYWTIDYRFVVSVTVNRHCDRSCEPTYVIRDLIRLLEERGELLPHTQ